MKEKFLIVNADDFGLSPGISRGILHTIKNGIVSSTSVIINNPYLSDTKKLIKENSGVDWGLHVVLRNNMQITPKTVVAETERQLDIFQKHLKMKPSHIDFHKGFKFNKRIYFELQMFVKKNKIAFRYDNLHRIETRFYGLVDNRVNLEEISIEKLAEYLDSATPGVTELICHPGWTSNRLGDPYRMQRNIEVKVLTDNRVINAVRERNINIINFRQYRKHVIE